MLDKDTSLGEKIRTLFREQGITIASILTAIGMAIGVLVEALLPGSAAATSGGGEPNLPNLEVICVENTELCSKNLFLHINEETLALSHLSIDNDFFLSWLYTWLQNKNYQIWGVITTFLCCYIK